MDRNLVTGLETKIVWMARLTLGLVFLWASVHKILDPGAFARAVANYRMLPETWVNLFAVTLPWVEFLCALLLLSGQWVRTSSLMVSGLLVVFIVAVSFNMIRGLDIDCGCFDTDSGRKIGVRLLVEDTLYLVLCLFLIFRVKDGLGWKAFQGVSRIPPP